MPSLDATTYYVCYSVNDGTEAFLQDHTVVGVSNDGWVNLVTFNTADFAEPEPVNSGGPSRWRACTVRWVCVRACVRACVCVCV